MRDRSQSFVQKNQLCRLLLPPEPLDFKKAPVGFDPTHLRG